MENHNFNGKIHYFYGHFQLQTVSSPEGNCIFLVAEHGEFSNGETTIRNGGIWCNQWWFNHEQQVVF